MQKRSAWAADCCRDSDSTVSANSHVFGLFPRTGVVWIFVLLLSYNLALVPPCMLVSLLFNKVKSASNAAGATAPNILALKPNLPLIDGGCVAGMISLPILLSIPLGIVGGYHTTKLLLCLFAPIGFALSLGRIVELEAQGVGLSWATAAG